VMPHRAAGGGGPTGGGASPSAFAPLLHLSSDGPSGACSGSQNKGFDFALGGEGVSQLTGKVVNPNQNCVLVVTERGGSEPSLGRVGVVTWDGSGGGTVEYVQ